MLPCCQPGGRQEDGIRKEGKKRDLGLMNTGWVADGDLDCLMHELFGSL